ncbi:MAG: PEP-CTERM sorting domain-containing protein [Bryobacterales bacterium]|nr:PEP-CTERM sorting domain-containing protein [Bryobacterales bacterium]
MRRRTLTIAMRMRVVCAIALPGLFLAGGAYGAAIAPCSGAGSLVQNIIPVRSSQMTYCVSDHGWSDSWFLGNPAQYDGAADVLSGDDGLSLRWTGGPSAGNGWLSPRMDLGTLIPQNTNNTVWSKVSPGNVTSHPANTPYSSTLRVGSATLTNTANRGIEVDLRTTVVGFQVTIEVTIRNLASVARTNVQFGDYFNFHPNGSCEYSVAFPTCTSQNNSVPAGFTGPALKRNQGTTQQIDGYMWAFGDKNRPDFLADGVMWGETWNGSEWVFANPNNWHVGVAQPFNPDGSSAAGSRVWEVMQNNSGWNNSLSPFGPWDSAGAMQWNLGTLSANGQLRFRIVKELVPVPEPAAWQLLLGGGALLAFRRYRHRRA